MILLSIAFIIELTDYDQLGIAGLENAFGAAADLLLLQRHH